MSLLHNKLTWFIRKSFWKHGLDICRTPNIKLMLSKVDVVIDAGANIGDSYDYFRSLGYRGQIISYEPTPETFKILNNRKGYNWSRFQKCLSDKAGPVKFFIRKQSTFGDWNGLLPMIGRNSEEEIITVEACRLDNLVHFNGRKASIFLKIDTEGHDIAVLKGASGLFDQIKYVLMEIPVSQRFEGDLDFVAAISEVEKLGFKFCSVLGNIHNDDATRSQALDVIFEPR
jgi:FkbM family methyltransferase